MKPIKKVLIALATFVLIGLSCRTLLPTKGPSGCDFSFCLNGISIIFEGQRLNEYTVQLQFPNQEPIIFSCPRVTTFFEDSPYQFPIECTPEGIFLTTTDPASLSLIINWEGGSVSQEYSLDYKPSKSSDGCNTECKRAMLELALENAGTPVVSLFPTPTSTSLPLIEKSENARWKLVGEDVSGDWLTYATPFITSVALDGDYIWAGAYGGLLRWDRKTGDVLQFLAPQTFLPDNDISNVILYENNLYIATETAVAIFDRQNKWMVYKNSEMGLGTGSGNEFALYDGEIWVANETGLAHFLNGQWSVIKSGSDTFSLEIIGKVIAKEDGIYIQGSEKLGDQDDITFRYKEGMWEKLSLSLQDDVVTPDGTHWKSDYDQVFLSKDGGKTWEFAFQWEDYITPLISDEQGRLYLASDATLLVYENNQFSEVYRFTNIGPELNSINIIRQDESGRIWFATDGLGLTMFNGEQWFNWQPKNSAMRHDAIRGMMVMNEKVYAGGSGAAGEGGVMIYDIAKNRWSNYWPGESELSGGGVGGIAVDKSGRAFFPTAAGVLDILDNEVWTHVQMKPMPNRQILTISDGIFDAKGNYWLGTDGLGIWKYDGKNWSAFGTKSKLLPSDRINAIAIDANDLMWVLTGLGLSVQCSEKNWVSFAIPGANDEIYSGDIAVDAQNRVWVVANGDVLAVFNGHKWISFSPDVVGDSMWGDAIVFDKTGRVWVGLLEGVGVFKGNLALEPQINFDVCQFP